MRSIYTTLAGVLKIFQLSIFIVQFKNQLIT